jgi:hypothetical protein
MTARNLAIAARQRWDFDAAHAFLDDAIVEMRELTKSDPGGWSAVRNYLCDSIGYTGNSRFPLNWLQGNLAEIESDLREAIAAWMEPATSPDNRVKLVRAHEALARVFAATGRDAAADAEVAMADRAPERDLAGRPWLTERARILQRLTHDHFVRQVERERLNWVALRDSAERSLRIFAATAERDTAWNNAEANARRDLWWAAYHLNQPTVGLSPSGSTRSDWEGRDLRFRAQLYRVDSQARNGDREGARTRLRDLWPEAEAILAAAPSERFNQVQHARALSIRAEIEEADSATKRNWLERAAGWLRPAAATGKLTRYEREVILGRIERQLGELNQPLQP